MYKRRYTLADAAAAFRYIWFHFHVHPFSISAVRKIGSGQRMGGPLRQAGKINYRRFNPYSSSITHLHPPQNNNEPNAEWLHKVRKAISGEKIK